MPLIILFMLVSITLLAGVMLGSLTLVPAFILTCFAIPRTIKLSMSGTGRRYIPLLHCLAAIVLLLAVFSTATWGCFHFLCRGLGGYITGILVALIIGLYRCNEGWENIADYWGDPAQYRDPRFIIKGAQFFLAHNSALSERTTSDVILSLLDKIDYNA